MRTGMIASAIVHGGVVVWLLTGVTEPRASLDAGLGGIEVSFGSPGLPGQTGPTSPLTEETESADPPSDPAETAEPVPDQPTDAPPVVAEAATDPATDPVENPDPVEPPREIISVEEEPSDAVVAEVPDRPAPVPAAKPPVPKPPVSEPAGTETARPAPAPAPAPVAEAETRTLASSAASGDPTGKSGEVVEGDAGSADPSMDGGTPGASADYRAALVAWLERHKNYPQRARMRRQEGTVLLRFTLNRQGRVLAHRIERGSGHTVLDTEVTAMIERAQPLPPIPADISRNSLEFVVPIQFALR